MRFSFNHQLTFAAIPPKRRGRWLALALLLPLMGGVLAYVIWQLTRAPEPAAVSSTTRVPAPASVLTPAAAEPSGNKVDVVVRRNDTIEGIFRQLKLSAADLKTVLDVPGVGRIFKQLQPGDKLTVIHDGTVLNGINRRISETEVVSVTRSESGFAAERIITLN